MIPSQFNVNPDSGSSNATISISRQGEYSGRINRVSEISGKIVGASANSVFINVTEEGPGEVVILNNYSITVTADAQIYTITGESNCPGLAIVDEDLHGWYTPAMTYYVTPAGETESTAVTNASNIPDDPGASSRYYFTIDVIIQANETTSVRTGPIQFKTTTDGSTTLAVFELTQQAGEEPDYLWLNNTGTTSTDVVITQTSEDVEINVLSNASWTFLE